MTKKSRLSVLKRHVFWKDDSLYISDDMAYELELDALISSVVSDFDPFGKTEINKEQWNMISVKAKESGGELLEAIREVTLWAEENYRRHKAFTILGL